MNNEISKIDSFEIVSVNPQVVKINEQMFYGFYLLNRDEKIINIISLKDNLINDIKNHSWKYQMNLFKKYNYLVLCITSLGRCIRLFKEFKWYGHMGNKGIQFFISNLNFNKDSSSVSLKLEHYEDHSFMSNHNCEYIIQYDIKQHIYNVTEKQSNQNKILGIPLATNFTEMVSVNYNKDDDILSSYEKIKKENENIMNHLNSIVEFNKIKNDEIESLKIINKKHFESNFIELNKEIEHLRKENSNIIEIKKENDIMKQTISLQEIKINSCQNTIYDLEKYIKQLENKLEEMNHCCFRCNDKYIKPDKKINCEHKYICNHCTLNICMCPKCNTLYG